MGWPLGVAFACVLSSRFIHLTGLADVGWMCTTFLIASLSAAVLWWCLTTLRDEAVVSDTFMAMFSIFGFVLGMASTIVYRPTQWSRMERRSLAGMQTDISLKAEVASVRGILRQRFRLDSLQGDGFADSTFSMAVDADSQDQTFPPRACTEDIGTLENPESNAAGSGPHHETEPVFEEIEFGRPLEESCTS